MPYLETVDELAERLADMLGIYRQRLRFEGMSPRETQACIDLLDLDHDHANDCGCRQCWCGRMETRIRHAVKNEEQMAQRALKAGTAEAGK